MLPNMLGGSDGTIQPLVSNGRKINASYQIETKIILISLGEDPSIMSFVKLKPTEDPDSLGREMYRLISDLYPICRSITGNGLRARTDLASRNEVHDV